MASKEIAPHGEKVSYQLQSRKCGKTRCRTCREGDGHGPYWYAYWRRMEDGEVTSAYIGKILPADVAEKLLASAQNITEGQPIAQAVKCLRTRRKQISMLGAGAQGQLATLLEKREAMPA